MTAECTLKVSTPAELIAAIPYLIGFHPAESIAVVAVRGIKIVFAARYDLPAAERPAADARAEAAEVARVVADQGVTSATVLGYGEEARVGPTVWRVAAALERAGVPVLDQLRVGDGRYWSFLCHKIECCPPEGRPCLPADSAIAAAATFSGAVALPDRAALVAQLGPAPGPGQAEANVRACARLFELCDQDSHEAGRLRRVRRAGRAAVRSAERRYRTGGRLTDDEVAWLGALIAHLPVRDYAWKRTGDEQFWVDLWMDVLRRVEPACVPGPACLLGFAAWRAGHGALARAAIDRAIERKPDYEMAALLSDLLQLGVHPRAVADWPKLEPFSGPVPNPSPWRVELPRPGRAVVDERLEPTAQPPKRRKAGRRVL